MALLMQTCLTNLAHGTELMEPTLRWHSFLTRKMKFGTGLTYLMVWNMQAPKLPQH